MSDFEQLKSLLGKYTKAQLTGTQELDYLLDNAQNSLEILSRSDGVAFIKTLSGKDVCNYNTLLCDILMKWAAEQNQGRSHNIRRSKPQLQPRVQRTHPIREREPLTWFQELLPLLDANFSAELFHSTAKPMLEQQSIIHAQDMPPLDHTIPLSMSHQPAAATSTPSAAISTPSATNAVAEYVDGMNRMSLHYSPIQLPMLEYLPVRSRVLETLVEQPEIGDPEAPAEPAINDQPDSTNLPTRALVALQDEIISTPGASLTPRYKISEPNKQLKRRRLTNEADILQCRNGLPANEQCHNTTFNLPSGSHVVSSTPQSRDHIQPVPVLTQERDELRCRTDEISREVQAHISEFDLPDVWADDEILQEFEEMFQGLKNERKRVMEKRKEQKPIPLIDLDEFNKQLIISHQPSVNMVIKTARKIVSREKILYNFWWGSDFIEGVTDSSQSLKYRLEVEEQRDQSAAYITAPWNELQHSNSQIAISAHQNLVPIESFSLEGNFEAPGESNRLIVPEFVGETISEHVNPYADVLRPKDLDRIPYTENDVPSNRGRRKRKPVSRVVDELDKSVPHVVRAMSAIQTHEGEISNIEMIQKEGVMLAQRSFVTPARNIVPAPEMQEECNLNMEMPREADSFAYHYNEWKKAVLDAAANKNHAIAADLVDAKKTIKTGSSVEQVLNTICNKLYTPIEEVMPSTITRMEAARRMSVLLEFQTRNIISLERTSGCNITAIETHQMFHKNIHEDESISSETENISTEDQLNTTCSFDDDMA